MTTLTTNPENVELASLTPVPPSKKLNAQGPVEKPGEPLAVTLRTIPSAEDLKKVG